MFKKPESKFTTITFVFSMTLTKTAILILLPGLLYSQEMRSLKFDELKKESVESVDTLLIYNFWATWCKPCIEELPYFEKVNLNYSKQKVKVILVNLDFNSKINEVTIPFIKKKNLQSSIYHITDTDPNEWINQIDESWSGAIPATVMYLSGEKVYFFEGQVKEQEMIWEIDMILEKRDKNQMIK